MLIRFTVGNFLSFNKPQEFSMIGGKVRSKAGHLEKGEKINILKFASIFGANASGKSNLIASMEFSQKVILNDIPIDMFNKYCRINDENRVKPSSFEFEIKIGKKYYAYGFDIIVSERSIVEEWFYEIGPNSTESEIFVRDIRKKEIRFGKSFDERSHFTLQTYADSMESNDTLLFLTEMNRNKEDLYVKMPSLLPLKEVYRWFDEVLVINHPNKPISRFSYFMDEKRMDETNKIISSLGLGIRRCQIVEENVDELKKYFPQRFIEHVIKDMETKIFSEKNKNDKTPRAGVGVMLREGHNFFLLKVDSHLNKPTVQKIQFEHENEGIWFELYEESDGTRRMLDLIELIYATSSGSKKVYVIDEIDRSLHPQLTYRFIESYLNLVDKGELQLIVTTHEAHILDLNLLRRDEIWFIDKNHFGESSLYSLEQYSERFDKKIDKAYLDGRYGGVPLFDEIFPMRVEVE
ncbi:MAG: AAA family ATPase [Candidatus Cloacimonetes bacterium]|nr:AAA family ATPase [Candidatus Cloacimonadota bacterium]